MTYAAVHEQSPEMRRCIEACQQCHDACVEAIAYCLARGDRHAEPEHISLLLDCARACVASTDSMLRGSPVHDLLCNACAEVAQHCAASCQEFGDDQQMQACARQCLRCADSCRAMSGG